MRLSRIQQTTRQRIRQLAGRHLLIEALSAEMVEILSAAISNDGYRLLGIDPATRFINRVLAASENDDWARRAWFREAYLASDPLTYIEPHNLMRWGLLSTTVQARQDECWGFPKEALAQISSEEHYNGFYETQCPVGGVLMGTFAAQGRWTAMLQLYRREENFPFQRTDVEFLKLLAPTIGLLLSQALICERASQVDLATVPDSSGVLILDATGESRVITPAGEEWLRLLNQTDSPRNYDRPAAISSLLAGMKSGDLPAEPRSLMASTRAGVVSVEASPAGSDGSVAIVLTPQRKPPRPEPPLDWPLTRQEREVTSHILLGLTNREIAGRMFISENTVQTHVRHIFDKLDVSRRAQLSARFFHDVYLPGLVDSSEC